MKELAWQLSQTSPESKPQSAIPRVVGWGPWKSAPSNSHLEVVGRKLDGPKFLWLVTMMNCLSPECPLNQVPELALLIRNGSCQKALSQGT